MECPATTSRVAFSALHADMASRAEASRNLAAELREDTVAARLSSQ